MDSPSGASPHRKRRERALIWREQRWFVPDNEHRPRGNVDTLCNSVEVDEGRAAAHHLTQAHVVAVVRVGAAIAVAKKAVIADLVVIRPLSTRDGRCGGDADRKLG